MWTVGQIMNNQNLKTAQIIDHLPLVEDVQQKVLWRSEHIMLFTKREYAIKRIIPHLVLSLIAAAALLKQPVSVWAQQAAENESTTKKESMTEPATGLRPVAEDKSIRPFRINVPEAELTELRRRINATKWPEREYVADQTQGVQLATIQKLARYWATDYDWRKVEAKLKALPQFITNIDGLDIHFIHVRSKHENALPLIITHGWPGSIIEQLKIIDPLTNPTAHGGKAEDAFDVVIPSLPGYGFSGKPTASGWDPPHIARAWTVLMKRLGYTKFVAQGGDWGNAVSEQMALQAPPELLGISTNMAATVPAEIAKALSSGNTPPATLSADERHAWDQLDFFYKKGLGYANEMALRPQTLYGIEDSPVGLAAWILDHDAASLGLISRVFDGQSEGLTRDDVLDNITLYWLTNTAISSARLYWENGLTAKKGFFDVKNVAIPVAVSAFPDEIYQAPRSWAERAYPKLIHYGKLDKGGHFAAWEQPKLFVNEVRMSFKSLR
jgi:pimeloyl-ACP methyl ester carboxylesterase